MEGDLNEGEQATKVLRNTRIRTSMMIKGEKRVFDYLIDYRIIEWSVKLYTMQKKFVIRETCLIVTPFWINDNVLYRGGWLFGMWVWYFETWWLLAFRRRRRTSTTCKSRLLDFTSSSSRTQTIFSRQRLRPPRKVEPFPIPLLPNPLHNVHISTEIPVKTCLIQTTARPTEMFEL